MRAHTSVDTKRFGPGRIAIILVVIAVSGALVSKLAAQQPPEKTRRLNHIIEQFEQGRPSFNNEHWVFITLTNNPFILPEVQKQLNDLQVEGSRPKVAPIIRLANWGGGEIEHVVKQFLSSGAMGIIVPEVTTRDQARKLAKAMRWPPQRSGFFTAPPVGVRGCCPANAPRYWGLSLHDYFVQSDLWWPGHPNGNLLALVMVESREAIKNVNEILSEPGIAGVLVGPHDLSMDLGVGKPESNPAAPEVEESTGIVARACLAHKSICGTFENTDVKGRIAQGFRLFPVARPANVTTR